MIIQKFNTSAIDVRNFKTGTSYVPLSQTSDWCRGYDWATVHVWWEGFDAYDGVIELRVKRATRIPDWASVAVPGQFIGIEDQFGDGTGKGRHIFMDVDLHCDEIMIYIDRGSATVGSVYYDIAIRTQYSEQIAAELKTLNSKIDSLLKFI